MQSVLVLVNYIYVNGIVALGRYTIQETVLQEFSSTDKFHGIEYILLALPLGSPTGE